MTMRLICPNCDAQYEVPDDVMPAAGRDVQCSNCGQTWFQHHPDNAPEAEEDDFADDVMRMKQRGPDEDTEAAAAASLPDLQPFGDEEEDAPFEDDQDDDFEDEFDPEEETPQPAPAAPVRRPLDPAIAEILRQEAAAEQEARRRRQSEPLESQPDLGLDDAPQPQRTPEIAADDHVPEDEDARRAHEARLRMAKMRGEPVPESEVDAYGSASRRDLLPDIEEINSTLRHDGQEGAQAGPTPTAALDRPEKPQKSGGFMRGFTIMIVLAAILAAVYVYAPEIAQSLPQADPYLSSYVAWMDDARLWLDGQLQDLLVWLDTVATQSQG
jgi:predicted Zn finger-like uncharacterized protein